MYNNNKSNNIIALIFFIFSLLIGLLTIDNYMDWGGDNAQILTQALALANNTLPEHFKDYSYIINNSIDPIGTRAYSWGTPILMSIIYKFLGLNYYAFKIIMCLSLSGTIFLLYKELAKRTNIPIACMFTSLFLFSPFILDFANEIRKDYPFLFLSFLTIILINNLLKNSEIRFKIKNTIIVSICTLLCLLFRENGSIIYFFLIYAYIFDLIKNKNQRKINSILYGFSILLITIPFKISTFLLPFDYVLNLLDYNFFQNLTYYVKEFRNCFFNIHIQPFSNFYIILTGLLLFLGIIKNFKKNFLYISFLSMILFTFLYSACQGIRYIFPYIPFVFIFMALGVFYIKNKKIKTLVFTLLLIMTIINIKDSTIYVIERVQYKDKSKTPLCNETIDIYEYIKKNTKTTDKIIYCKPRILHFYTKRLGFQISDKKELLNKADYQLSIIGQNNPGEFYNKEMFNIEEKTYIEEANVYLTPVYKNKNYILYKIDKD